MAYQLIRRWHKTGRETRQAKTYTDFHAAAVAAQFMEGYYQERRRPCSVRIETVTTDAPAAGAGETVKGRPVLNSAAGRAGGQVSSQDQP